ncbi:chaplin [Streptomyces sp. NPDC048002]|uniref:chaplin n=1 Tax=Streptomyces sp. NPDC048002 TaxID=3154344 RepID=UPI0033D338CE
MFAVAAVSGAMAVTMPAQADSGADGAASGSPGALSGSTLRLPVHLPVNACGNTVNVVGLLNPAAGNACAEEEPSAEPAPEPPSPPRSHPDPEPRPAAHTPHGPGASLARTGADRTVPALAGSAALIAAGAVLYRRSGRRASR